jgi:SAM-dependent methyltransferase
MAPEVADLMSTARGIVLDIGPGTGIQLHKFTPSKITKCYGAEPAVDMHPELKHTAHKCLLGEKYEVVACGVEPESLIPGLARAGLLANGASSGVFDTIVSIRALCSVKNPEETAAGLYRLLKPGGRLILYEHVKQPYPNGGDRISALLQKVYMLAGWSFFLGCRLTNDTESAVRKAGGPRGWKEIDMASRVPYTTTPYIIGELVKSK